MGRERPILFSAPMVRALLEGRKTQTRRLNGLDYINNNPKGWADPGIGFDPETGLWAFYADGYTHRLRCPYGQPGDRLWVRETWAPVRFSYDFESGYCDDTYESTPKSVKAYLESPDAVTDLAFKRPKEVIAYAANGDWEDTREDRAFPWRPSIFMPRWASRLTLEITDVRVQRVQEISEEDAKAEGFEAVAGKPSAGCADIPAVHAFLRTFYDMNKRAPRSENPWVWVLTFKALSPAGPLERKGGLET